MIEIQPALFTIPLVPTTPPPTDKVFHPSKGWSLTSEGNYTMKPARAEERLAELRQDPAMVAAREQVRALWEQSERFARADVARYCELCAICPEMLACEDILREVELPGVRRNSPSSISREGKRASNRIVRKWRRGQGGGGPGNWKLMCSGPLEGVGGDGQEEPLP